MLLIGNGLVLTMDEKLGVLKDGAVLVEGETIVKVDSTERLRHDYPSAQFIDAEGRLIMPGMINGHMHLYSTFARGLALADPPANFIEILEKLWWKLDKVLSLEDVYYSAMMPLIDCIKAGTTTIIDHHASPYAVSASLEEIVRAVEATGVRTALAYEVSDRDGKEICDAGIEENIRAIEKYAGGEHPLLGALFGLHASLTLSDETLKRCKDAVGKRNVGFHIHTAEGIQDVEDSLERYGKRVVERLADFGILGPQTIAVHCVHVNENEIDILRKTDTMVVHNPESNMGNAVGVAPVIKMLDQGVLVGLGTDGFTADMFESVKVANVLHKLEQRDPGAAWDEVPQMIFDNNREIARRIFGKDLGILREGAAADIILVDYDPATPFNQDTAYPHLLFGVSGGMVDTTIINGKVRMLHRKIEGIDTTAVAAKARSMAAGLWDRF